MSQDPFTVIYDVIEKPECCCEYVDIGVGHQKVVENPDCPRCTPSGLAGAILTALADAGLLAQDDNRSPECMTGGRLHDDCDNDLGCTCGCHANGTSGPQGDEPAAPRVWAMPSEPGPDVVRVRDVHGQCFTRADAPLWVGDTFADDEDVPDLYLTWKQLMGQGPLTEVVDGSQT